MNADSDYKDSDDNLSTPHQFIEMKEEEVESGSKYKRFLRRNLLTIATVVGVLAGGGLGAILKSSETPWTSRQIMYVNFPGDLFLRMLKALILPLIVSSLVSAIANLDLSLSKRIAFRAISYYLTTTFAAVCMGIILVVVIKPGKNHSGHDTSKSNYQHRNVTTVDTLLDLVSCGMLKSPNQDETALYMSAGGSGDEPMVERRILWLFWNMFPPNLVQACTQLSRTNLVENKNEPDIYKWKVGKETFEDGMNILGLVVFATALGIAISQLGERGKPLAHFFNCLTDVSMRITTWVICISPVGVLFLVCSQTLGMQDIGQVMGQLGLYFATVMLGLGVQAFVVLPLLYFLLTRKSPVTYTTNMIQALATAFGTASSSATLPLTIRCLEEKNGVDPRVARFALPIGATINMDGTALYEAVAAIFIAQARNVDLTLGKLIAISITATAASIGAAGIPQAGLVTMVMVLDTVGLPAEDVGLILAVDWLLDRFRTTINVMGDAFGAGIVSHRSQKELQQIKPVTS